MTAIAGSIQQVSIRGRIFSVPADASPSIDPGGVSVEHQPNGDGTTRKVETRRTWKITGLPLSIDHVKADLQFLQEIMRGENVPITITMPGEITYGGEGTVSGDGLELQTESTTVEVEMSGPGELEQQ